MKINLNDRGHLTLKPDTGAEELLTLALLRMFYRGGELKIESGPTPFYFRCPPTVFPGVGDVAGALECIDQLMD